MASALSRAANDEKEKAEKGRVLLDEVVRAHQELIKQPRHFDELYVLLHERALFITGAGDGLITVVENILRDLRSTCTHEPLTENEGEKSFIRNCLLRRHSKDSAPPPLEEAEKIYINYIEVESITANALIGSGLEWSEVKESFDKLNEVSHGHAKVLWMPASDKDFTGDEPGFIVGDCLIVAAARIGSVPLVKAILCLNSDETDSLTSRDSQGTPLAKLQRTQRAPLRIRQRQSRALRFPRSDGEEMRPQLRPSLH